MSLREVIAEVIRREGPIPFSRYMDISLYHPREGYYMRSAERFGRAGDFYTSSDIHAIFGRLLCRQFDEMWRALGCPSQLDLVELGPGRGLFAADVLDWATKKFPEFAAALRYRCMETSPDSCARISERLKPHVERGAASVHESLERAAEELCENVVVFANEFFDALPVEVLTSEGEVRVDVEGGRFVERFVPARPEVLAYVDRYSVHPAEGQRVEANLAAQEWTRRIAGLFGERRGFCVFVDYGYTRNEQLAGRHLDTIMTYRAHQASPDPYAAPGEQDITAHVNFTALAGEAERCGLSVEALLTQAAFLMGIGEQNEFGDALEECRLPQERAKRMLQLKHLVTPAGIGEVFQVLVLSRGVQADAARSLSGLRFRRQ